MRTRNDERCKPSNAENEEWAELRQRNDRIGIRYLRAARLRRKRKRSKQENEFLAEFDPGRELALLDPQSAMDQASLMVHRGLMLLESVIYEQQQKVDDSAFTVFSEAMGELSSMAMDLRDDLIRYAEEGSRLASLAIFREGQALASAFSRLAIAKPEQFREYAERSLTMPSLRARNSAFTCDADAIITAVHLAEKHHASDIHDNRSRIGALCHQFVAHVVDVIEAARLEGRAKADTTSEWFNFPELKGNAKVWWKTEVKDWVHREFVRMKANAYRNPALWAELERVTDHGTDSAKRAALEKYCFNKLEQIAGKAAKSG